MEWKEFTKGTNHAFAVNCKHLVKLRAHTLVLHWFTCTQNKSRRRSQSVTWLRCFSLIHAHVWKKALAFIIFMENMTWATRHVNNPCHNGHFERSQVHTPCAPYPFARGTLAFSLSTTQTRVRAQSVLLIVSPFNHHWQRKRAVAGAKWCDERRGEGAGREGGVKEKDEGDDILKLAGCAKVTDDLMLVVTLLCHRNQVICQTPLSSPPLSSRFHLFRLYLSSPRVSSPAEKYPNYFLFWISHWPTDLAEKMKLSSQHFH